MVPITPTNSQVAFAVVLPWCAVVLMFLQHSAAAMPATTLWVSSIG
jgi:hypothetical protein